MIDQQLLEVLACPLCKGKLLYDPHAKELVCRVDKLAYAIQDNIPVMLPDSARRLNQDEH